jgi:hypothetical protein
MATLTNTKIKDTYDGLLKTTTNEAIAASGVTLIEDGLGNASALSVGRANNGVTITGSLNATLATAAQPNITSVGTLSSLAVSGDLNVDSGTLFVDASANSVGIGTITPLSLSGSNLSIVSSGNVRLQLDSTNDYRILSNTTGNFAIQDSTNSSDKFTITGTGEFQFRNNSSEVMRIDSSGNVGIGTSSPRTKTHISGLTSNDNPSLGSSTAPLFVSNTANSYGLNVGVNNGGASWLQAQSNTSATAYDLLLNPLDGNVLIGTTGIPNGTSTYGAGFVPTTNDRVTLRLATSDSTANTLAIFYNPNGSVGSISVSGSSTSYNTSSDYRLKENVVPMEGALDRVDALKPSRFNFIADPEKTVDGFLAHEVAEVIPEAITGEKDAVDEEGNPIYQGIDQSKIVPLLVGAIRELKAEIESLKSQING